MFEVGASQSQGLIDFNVLGHACDCRAFLWTLIIITTGVHVLGGVLGDVVTLMVRSEAVVCAQPQHAAG